MACLLAACGSSTDDSSSAPSGDAYVATAKSAVDAGYRGEATQVPGDAPSPAAHAKLWIISCGEASQGCSTPTAAAKAAAQSLGWSVTVFDGNFGVGDAYNTGLRNAVAAGADAIITVAVDCNQAKTGYQAAKTAGIPVVGADSFDCSDPGINGGADLMSATTMPNDKTPTVADLHRERGKLKADWIIAHTKGQAKVINTNFQGIASGRYENQGFVDELKKCSSCKIVDTIDYNPADTANGNLKQVWSTALAQYPDANAAVVISDGIIIQNNMAQALKSLGLTHKLALVGGEGFAPNVALMRADDGQTAAAPFDSAWMGYGAVDTVIRLMAGQKPVPEGFGIQLIDADHNLPAEGKSYSSPVDYVSAYLKAWGR